jgi:dihydrofolate synthase / folylpolyglutamate synthase
MVLGMLRDKSHEAFVAPLASYADAWYVASLEGERGFSGAELARVVKSVAAGAPVHTCADVRLALAAAQAASIPGDRIVITGSFVTVGSAMSELGIGTLD